MNRKLSDRKTVRIFPYLIFYLFFLTISSSIVNMADDFIFQKGIESYGGFFPWLNVYARSWSGRLIPHGILVLLLQVPDIYFHLIDAFMWVVLLIYACKCLDFSGSLNKLASMAMLTLAIFTIIPGKVLVGSVFWKCANVLYLWAAAACLAALYPLLLYYYNKPLKKRDYILGLIGCVYTSSFEQAAIFMSVASVLLLAAAWIKNKTISYPCLVLTVIGILGTILFFAMPGNAVRVYAETLRWMQKYDMFTIYEKALLAVDYAIFHSEQEVPVLFVALALIVCGAFYKYRAGSSPLFLVIGASLAVYFSLNYAYQLVDSVTGIQLPWISLLYRSVEVDTTSFATGTIAALSETVNVMMVALLGACLAVIIPGEFDMLSFILYFGGLATSAMMGFSPTIYVSDARPRFFGYLLMILALYRSIASIASHSKAETAQY